MTSSISSSNKVTIHEFLRILEDFTNEHMKTVRALNKTLNRLKRDISNERLQTLSSTYLKRLRVLRKRLLDIIEKTVVTHDVEDDIKNSVSTLGEYIIMVSSVYEEHTLRKALVLARRRTTLLSLDVENIERDLEDLDTLSRKFQEFISKMTS